MEKKSAAPKTSHHRRFSVYNPKPPRNIYGGRPLLPNVPEDTVKDPIMLSQLRRDNRVRQTMREMAEAIHSEIMKPDTVKVLTWRNFDLVETMADAYDRKPMSTWAIRRKEDGIWLVLLQLSYRTYRSAHAEYYFCRPENLPGPRPELSQTIDNRSDEPGPAHEFLMVLETHQLYTNQVVGWLLEMAWQRETELKGARLVGPNRLQKILEDENCGTITYGFNTGYWTLSTCLNSNANLPIDILPSFSTLPTTDTRAQIGEHLDVAMEGFVALSYRNEGELRDILTRLEKLGDIEEA